MLTICIKNRDYPLATTLRVAYEIQGQHNHKPYAEVFRGIADMGVEQQVGIVYAAFKCANPEEAKEINLKAFQEHCYDTLNLKDLMSLLQGVVKGIMGEEESDAQGSVPATLLDGAFSGN